jgi:hypothetical protein
MSRHDLIHINLYSHSGAAGGQKPIAVKTVPEQARCHMCRDRISILSPGMVELKGDRFIWQAK